MKIAKDDIWRFYANSDEIPQNLKQSVLFFEDRHFYNHFGVNFFSLLRAFAYNFTQNSTQRLGGSTITMQVARMMNPKERTYANKIIEIFNAFQLEFHYTKDEILTMYFNLAPYGGNIEGVKTTLVNTINVYDLLKYNNLVITLDTVKKLEEVYA